MPTMADGVGGREGSSGGEKSMFKNAKYLFLNVFVETIFLSNAIWLYYHKPEFEESKRSPKVKSRLYILVLYFDGAFVMFLDRFVAMLYFPSYCN